jgi:hypothetical protein
MSASAVTSGVRAPTVLDVDVAFDQAAQETFDKFLNGLSCFSGRAASVSSRVMVV